MCILIHTHKYIYTEMKPTYFYDFLRLFNLDLFFYGLSESEFYIAMRRIQFQRDLRLCQMVQMVNIVRNKRIRSQ